MAFAVDAIPVDAVDEVHEQIEANAATETIGMEMMGTVRQLRTSDHGRTLRHVLVALGTLL